MLFAADLAGVSVHEGKQGWRSMRAEEKFEVDRTGRIGVGAGRGVEQEWELDEWWKRNWSWMRSGTGMGVG